MKLKFMVATTCWTAHIVTLINVYLWINSHFTEFNLSERVGCKLQVVLKSAGDNAAIDEINIDLENHQQLNENFNFDLNPASSAI